MSKSSPRYPVATVAAYGPDNTLATKLVVAVVDKKGQLLDQRTWQTVAVDVRHDPVIAADVTGFIKQRGARETVSYDRIIGCPHEEGVDYPLGRACPTCHFWERINRFTHEPVVVAEPTMSAAEILTELSREQTVQPREALVSADGHRQELVDPLLRALERGIANPVDASEEEAALFVYALYLFAKWREPRAYPYVCRWLSLPRDEAFDLAGDVVTEDGPRILAAVCDENLEPIKTVILNREADEYGRAEAINALALLAAWAEVPRESVVTHLQWLAREGLEREYSYVWNALAAACLDIEALPVFPELRRAFDDGLIEPDFMAVSELDDIEAAPRGERLERTREERPPIDDVIEATAWWAVFADGLAGTDGEPGVPSAKVGRNEPCPCGSGKKYKKCHGA